MKNSIFAQAVQFIRDRRDNRRWQAAVCCLAILVAGGTAWALVRQAQAYSDSKGDILDCEYEVHEHSEECYEGERLVCGKVELVIHTHDDSCYSENGKLVCQLPELKEEDVHVHDDSCFEEEEKGLICGLEEATEVTAVSYAAKSAGEQTASQAKAEEVLICELEEHTHDDDCYTVSGEKTLTCEQEESEGHTHGDSCFTTTSTLACGQEEQAGHTHSDSCYTVNEEVDEETGESVSVRVLTCVEKESAGHTHGDSCLTTTSTLTCGQEEQAGHTHGDSCYTVTEESILTCEQAEHTHDKDSCYDTVTEDTADTKDEPTADDSVNIQDDAERHVHTDDCYGTVRVLVCGEEGLHTHDEDSCYDKDGTLICTALEVDADSITHTHGTLCFVEGEGEEYTQIFPSDDIIVTAYYRASAKISEEATMDVEQIVDKDDERYESRLAELEETDDALAEGEGMAMLLGFSFTTVDEKFVPKDTVRLKVEFLDDSIYAEGDEVTVASFGEDGVELIEGTVIDEDRTTTFDVDNLTEIAFIASVEKATAHELVYEGEDYIVTVTLGEDSEVPEDAQLVVEQTTKEDFESYTECFEKLDEAGLLDGNEIPALLLDLKIYAEDEKIVPDGTMEVKVQFLNGEIYEIYFGGDAVKAAYVTEDDTGLLEASDIDDELSTTFTLDELAGVAFIIDGGMRTMSAGGEDYGYIVTVRFGPKALIPEGAELVVDRITEENDPEHFAAREDQIQEEITDEVVTLGALFSIGFYEDGLAIEPQSTVDIKIQLLNGDDVGKADSIRVVHFVADEENAEGSVEIIESADVTKDGDGSLSTSFQTESFRSTETQPKEEKKQQQVEEEQSADEEQQMVD